MPTTSPAPRGGLLRRAGGLCALLLAGCAAQAPAPSPGRAGTPADSAAWSLPGFPHASTPAVRGHRASEVIWTRLRDGFALPDLDHPAVRRELDWYTAHPLFLEAMWARAERYLFYILGETDRRGLPTELALLPVVESGFRPQAVSPSAAAGLWQFIPGTGTHLGLRQDDWVDQRMDVLRSTAAALDYLTSLRDSFDGDWLLALAAYNGGPGYVGRLQEANRRAGRGTRFQDLPLREESETYVWRMLALRRLLADPQRYGVTLPRIADAQYFEVIQMPRQIDLDVLAALDELSNDEVIALNPGLRRGVTPPAGPHRVLVPTRVANAVHARLSTTLEPAEPWAQTLAVRPPQARPPQARPAPRTHTVARGDTLSAIARRYGTTVAAVQQRNGLRGTTLRPGERLRLPDGASPPPAARTGQSGPACPHTHTVAAGDSLWSVARNAQVGIAALRACNPGATSAHLRPGERLRLPASARTAPRTVVYQVRPGDTLTRISTALGVTLDNLLAWNHTLSPTSLLRAGDSLNLTLH